MKTTTWSAALGAGALVLSLAACGGDDSGSESGADTSADAAAEQETNDAEDTAAETEQEQADDEESGDDEAGGGGVESAEPGSEVPVQEVVARLKAPGEEALSSFSMTASIDAGGQALTMDGRADLSGEQPQMDMEMGMGASGSMHLILVGGEAFISMPGMTEQGMFVQVPTEQLDALGTESITDTVDLEDQFDAFEQASSIIFVGSEEVGGDPTDHYQIELSDEALKELDGDMASMDSLTYDVWVDADDFMRQIEFDLGGQGSMTMQAEGWGEPVDVQRPDDSQLTQINPEGMMGSTPTGR